MQRSWLREGIRRWGWYVLFLYVVLLLASHLYLSKRSQPDPSEDSDRRIVQVDNRKLAYLEWGGANPNLPPLILLHGSPGRGARDWEKIAPLLAVSGRRIIAIDRWGNGASEPKVDDYSFEADREAVIGLMDSLAIKRAHVAGWSYGGGPAILLGDLHRDRILSVSLIAAIGIQEGEGSGSYLVEHWKYSLLYVLANWLPEAIPHFGLLGSRSFRRAFARDFMDCDQRGLKSGLATLEVPLFIIHGKHDPLIPAWVAQEHHRLQPRSRLVMLDASHFFAFGFRSTEDLEIAVEEQNGFLAAVDGRTVSGLYGVRNETDQENLRALWEGGPSIRGYKPWWIVVSAGMVLGLIVPRSGGFLAGLAGALLIIDFLTGLTGILVGSIINRGESRSRFHKGVSAVLCGLVGFIPGAFLLPLL